tara:strand:+ start:16 stop:528 length:513 start_codon:yes stop_codon:yes gene_type:complete
MIKRKRKRLGKKGSLQDIMFIIGVLLFFGMIILFGFRISSAYDDQIQGMSEIPDNAKDASSSLTGQYTGILDNVFLLLTIGLAIVSLILAGMVRVHPVFIPIFFIILLITVFVAGVASNIFQSIASNSNMVGYASQLTFTSTVLEYLPLFIGVFGTLLMVVMYKLWSMDQ